MRTYRFGAVVVAWVAAACGPGSEESSSVVEPSVRFIDVGPDVRLEVLQWSVEGEPLVLLAGARHTAHVYEEFAPHFTDRFRVIGVTRRRHGASSSPTGAFGIDEFGRDIVAVLDTLSIESAHFIAHSFGGAELSHLALNFPERLKRLVYIDGSWDFSRVFYADGWRDPWPDIPMQPADSASPQAVASYFTRTWGPLTPLNEIRARHLFDDDGKLVDLDPGGIGSMFSDMIGPTLDTVDYSDFASPVMAIRALPETVSDMFLGYSTFDSLNQRLARETFERWVRIIGSEGRRFVEGVPGARELRAVGSHHEIHLTEPERIVPEIRAFLTN